MPQYICSLDYILKEAPINPDADKKPVTSIEPDTSEQPVASKTPDVSEQPVASKAPDVSEQPVATRTPDVSEQPVATRTPDASIHPYRSIEPLSSTIPSPLPETNKPLSSALPGENNSSVPGDANGDGIVTLADAQLVLKAALKLIKISELDESAADVDGRSGISLGDAQLVLKGALKLITLNKKETTIQIFIRNIVPYVQNIVHQHSLYQGI